MSTETAVALDEATDATVRVRRWARHHAEMWGAATLVAGWLVVACRLAARQQPDAGCADDLLGFAATVATGVAVLLAWWTVTTELIGHAVRRDTLGATHCIDGALVPNGRTMIVAMVFADDERVWLSAWHRRTYRRGRVLVTGRGRFRVAVWPGATRPVLLHRPLTPWGDAARHRAIARATGTYRFR